MRQAPYFSQIAQGPDGGTAFWATAADSKRLRVGHWRGAKPQTGTVFLFSGRTEYIELQGRIARDLVAHGHTVLTIDWRGHGLSDRVADDPATLHVESFDDYQKDVAAMVATAKALDVPKPWFLIGNSMGGNIGLRAIIEGLPISACAFTAPMWGIRMSRIQRMIAIPVSWAASTFGQAQAYIPGHDGRNYVSNNPFEGNRLTFDPDGYDYWVRQAREKPELQTAGSSMKWLLQSLLECNRLSKLMSPDVPCLAFCGDHDGLVDVGAIERRLASWRESTFIEVDHAKHGLLFERPHVRTGIISKIVEHFASRL